jgi:hypothetical protein
MLQLRREYATLKRELVPPVAKLTRHELEERVAQLRRIKEQMATAKPTIVTTHPMTDTLTFN